MALTPGVNVDSRAVQRVALVENDGNPISGLPGKAKLSTDELTRPSNTTAYAAGDVVSTLLTVTDATNAAPIVITTSANHGLATGDRVTIAGVGGNTAANGNFAITNVTATTFSLDGSTGNGAYTSGGTADRIFRFANCARDNGGSGLVIGAILADSANQATKGSYELWLFDTVPSSPNDNAAFAPTDAEAETLIGIIPFQTSYVGLSGSGAAGNCAYPVADIAIPFVCGASSKDLYGLLVPRNAYTPVSGEVFTIRLRVAQD